MFVQLSASVLVALAAAAQAASPGYGGYGGYGAHSYKHSHPSKPVHNTTSVLSSPTDKAASGTSNGAVPATSSSVILSTDVATIPLSTGVSSGSESAPIPASTESVPYPITSEIPGVSSSLGNSPIGTGISSLPNGPIGTGTGSGSGVTSAPGPAQTGDTTLTYTLGTGSSTTVVTTTIKHTSTKTNIETVYATEDASTGGLEPTGGAGEPTTTIEQTSTFTKVITVQPVASATGVLNGNSPVGGSGGSGAGGEGGSCKPQVTVTVTGPAQTVTVTAGSESSSNLGNSPIETAAPSIISSAPFGNGTTPETTRTKKKCASTGFITKPSASFTAHPTGYLRY